MSALAAIAVSYHLSGCRSLKERRRRLQPLLDRLGRQRHLALCLMPGDNPKAAQLTLAVLGADRTTLQERLDAVLRSLEDDVDAVVVSLDHELL